jgi:hypothetical protein
LQADLGARLPEDANFEIDQALAQRSNVFIWLGSETKAHLRRGRSHRRNELCGEYFNKTIIGSDRERPPQFSEVE